MSPKIRNLEDASRIAQLERRLLELEDERAVREVLSQYGFYADYDLRDEWLDLFTDDIDFFNPRVLENLYSDDPPKFRQVRFRGKEQFAAGMLVKSQHQAIVGHCQHHMGGMPLVVTFAPDGTAIARGYGIVYASKTGDVTMSFDPQPALQILMANRWRLRRCIDGRWRIFECLRQPMGSVDSHLFLSDVDLADIPEAVLGREDIDKEHRG